MVDAIVPIAAILVQSSCYPALGVDNGDLPCGYIGSIPLEFWRKKMITGSIVALLTPMHRDGSVDWESLEQLLDMHLAAGTNAIVAVGTTGESATLSVPEHCELIKYCVTFINGRMPVIAGTGANSTREAMSLKRIGEVR